MIETGLSREEAEELAADEVARPGTSEHQLGLAVDIISNAHRTWTRAGRRRRRPFGSASKTAQTTALFFGYPPEKSGSRALSGSPGTSAM